MEISSRYPAGIIFDNILDQQQIYLVIKSLLGKKNQYLEENLI